MSAIFDEDGDLRISPPEKATTSHIEGTEDVEAGWKEHGPNLTVVDFKETPTEDAPLYNPKKYAL